MNFHNNTGTLKPETPSEITKPQQPIMAKILRPGLCVQRDDNTVVPLIAMDELPDSVILKGVPIKLTVLEALRAHMELIPGDHRPSGIRYELDHPISIQSVSSEQGGDSGSDGSPTSAGSQNSTQKVFIALDKKGNKNAEDTSPVRTDLLPSYLALLFLTHILTRI